MDIKNVKPLKDKILVRRLETKEVTESGIIIPDTAQKKNTKAVVVAVGEGKISDRGVRIPIDLNPGDFVIFQDHAGYPVTVDGVEHQVITEDQVVVSGDEQVLESWK